MKMSRNSATNALGVSYLLQKLIKTYICVQALREGGYLRQEQKDVSEAGLKATAQRAYEEATAPWAKMC